MLVVPLNMQLREIRKEARLSPKKKKKRGQAKKAHVQIGYAMQVGKFYIYIYIYIDKFDNYNGEEIFESRMSPLETSKCEICATRLLTYRANNLFIFSLSTF